MKKIILSLILFCLISSTGFSQAFKKNNFVFTGGLGVGVGIAVQNYSPAYQGYNEYNLFTKTTVGFILPLAAEFAIHDKWGLGLTYAQNSYINDYTDKSKLNNYGVFGAFHLVSKERVELYTRLNFGLSYMTFIENPSASFNYSYETYTYQMKGGFAKPSFGLRVYFGKHIGIFADGGVGIYSVSSTKYESSIDGTHNLASKVRISMIGVEITGGLAFKL